MIIAFDNFNKEENNLFNIINDWILSDFSFCYNLARIDLYSFVRRGINYTRDFNIED